MANFEKCQRDLLGTETARSVKEMIPTLVQKSHISGVKYDVRDEKIDPTPSWNILFGDDDVPWSDLGFQGVISSFLENIAAEVITSHFGKDVSASGCTQRDISEGRYFFNTMISVLPFWKVLLRDFLTPEVISFLKSEKFRIEEEIRNLKQQT